MSTVQILLLVNAVITIGMFLLLLTTVRIISRLTDKLSIAEANARGGHVEAERTMGRLAGLAGIARKARTPDPKPQKEKPKDDSKSFVITQGL